MPASFFSPLIQPAPTTSNGYGSYGIKAQFYSLATKNWYTCREQFHGATTLANLKEVYVGCSGNSYFERADDIAKMLRELEHILNIAKNQRSVVSHCVETIAAHNPDDTGGLSKLNNDILHIKVSPFWYSSLIRAYFFTLAIKAINIQSQATLIGRLQSVSYSAQTGRAVARFLGGNTLFESNNVFGTPNGWVNFFGNGNIDRANALIVPYSKGDLKFFQREKPFSKLTEDQRDNLEKWVHAQEKSYGYNYPKFYFN